MVRNTHSQFAPLAWQHFETPRHERKALGIFLLITPVWRSLLVSPQTVTQRCIGAAATQPCLQGAGKGWGHTGLCACTMQSPPSLSDSVFSLRILVSRINKSPQTAALTMPATLLDFSLDAARSQLFLTTCGTLSGVREVSQPTAAGAPPRPT